MMCSGSWTNRTVGRFRSLEAGMYRGIFTGDRFLHIYRQLSPDPARSMRELLDRGPLARLRA